MPTARALLACKMILKMPYNARLRVDKWRAHEIPANGSCVRFNSRESRRKYKYNLPRMAVFLPIDRIFAIFPLIPPTRFRPAKHHYYSATAEQSCEFIGFLRISPDFEENDFTSCKLLPRDSVPLWGKSVIFASCEFQLRVNSGRTVRTVCVLAAHV